MAISQSYSQGIVRTISGSCHQGDIYRFGINAGSQCACNAVFALTWAKIKDVRSWTTWDLDFILRSGDKMYKDLGHTTEYLTLDDLPNSYHVLENEVYLEKSSQDDYLITNRRENSTLFENFSPDSLHSDNHGAIIICNEVSISLIFSTNSVFVFDSHSRDDLGLLAEDGSAVLIEFLNLRYVSQYLIYFHTFERINNLFNFIIQVQYVDIIINEQARAAILLRLRNLRQSFRRSERGGDAKQSRVLRQATDKHLRCENSKRKRKVKRTCKENSIKKPRKNPIDIFKSKIREGPFYVCVICNRSLYKHSVSQFIIGKYEVGSNFELFSHRIESYNNKEYICKTCNRKLLKKTIPCQAVCNSLQLFNLPRQMWDLRKLEKILIAQRLLFKKVTVMPKGQFPKIKGSICNVPIDASDICKTLPRTDANSQMIKIALKKKLNFKSYVCLETVRPDLIVFVLKYLKIVNPLYNDVDICQEEINSHVHDFSDVNEYNSESILSEPESEFDTENPLLEHQTGSCETLFVPNIQMNENNYVSIAPGEDNTPIAIALDDNCEELAFPYLFPTSKFGYKATRDIPISPTKYFNQRLLNYTQKFSSDSDYIFFAQCVSQNLNLANSIRTAMRKTRGRSLTAGMLSQNYEQTLRTFVARDDAFNFMNDIKGSPAYWKKFLNEVLALVKQLGLPTFFMTLSCADLRWNELIEIIQKLKNVQRTEEEINEMNYFQRTEVLNSNPVLLARHFQFRVETFVKEILKDGELGTLRYYAMRVEFQVRGSPHIHSLLWMLNAPVLSLSNIPEYTMFLDAIIRCEVPSQETEPELFKLVTTYQVHRHSKSCKKGNKKRCRYSFGRFFTATTIIATPLNDKLTDYQKAEILKERNKILSSVKEYIDLKLNPKTSNFLYPAKPNYSQPPSISEILGELNIDETKYYEVLSISSHSGFEIHLKRPPDSCFVNNYFAIGLLAWEANLDLQPVLDFYKAVSYMCAYISKSEDCTSDSMKAAAAEACHLELNTFEQMKKISTAYKTHREMSIQEAVYFVLPELWLRKTYPSVIFANSNPADTRYRILRSKSEISDLPEDSTDLFKQNMLDRYKCRPDRSFCNGKFAVLDNICYAKFLAHYKLDYSSKTSEDNDCQPNVLQDLFSVSEEASVYPEKIPLMGMKGYLVRRNVQCVLRYHVPNKHSQSEKYAHHMLLLFYPFRDETTLKGDVSGTYTEKLFQENVLEIVNFNKASFEPFADEVDNAFINVQIDLAGVDSFGEQENDDVETVIEEQENNTNSENNVDFCISDNQNSAVNTIDTDTLFGMIRNLNKTQRQVFDVINHWARRTVKFHGNVHVDIDPLYVFLSGSGGCGKSHLIRVIYHYLSKTFSLLRGDINKEKILVMAPTGVAAVNVEGSTIHSALSIPCGNFYGKNIARLPDKTLSLLRNQLSEVKIIICDEISMVSNKLLSIVHQRLTEIFGSVPDQLFAGISIIAVGDFYQLPPIRAPPVFAQFNDPMLNVMHPWQQFQLAELTEVMRQRGDQRLIELLNNIRIGYLTASDNILLRSRIISPDSELYPSNAMHIWAENKPVQKHNLIKLNEIEASLYSIESLDIYPKNLPLSLLTKFNERSQMDTGGLAHTLQLKIGARVMLTSNVDVKDKLNNGQIGTVYSFSVVNGSIDTVYIKFDDISAGEKCRRADAFAFNNSVVPIKKTEANIKVSPKNPNSQMVKRTQFPLMLAWACTIHKVQGKQFSQLVVNLNLERQKHFNKGQLYVALSRVTSLEGLFLVGNLDESFIRADNSATEEYDRMRKSNPLQQVFDFEESDCNMFIFCLLNVRSLLKHADDIRFDKSFFGTDVLCLTETQITPLTTEMKLNQIKTSIYPFQFYSNTHESDRYQSLAVCLKPDIQLLVCNNQESVMYFRICKPVFSTRVFTFLLIYRKNNSRIDVIQNLLQYFLSVPNPPDFILGDFNMNAIGNDHLLHVLHHYELVTINPTHISGSCIDHIYFLSSLHNQYNISSLIKSVYFSDHDALKATTPKKVKRDLFGDLTPNRKNKESDILGYIIGVSPPRRSRSSNNEYFDIEVQCGETEKKDIRVMVTKDSPASYQSFTKKKNSAVPVKISNCSISSSGTIFLNNASKVETAFPHECCFLPTSASENATSIKDILTCSQGSFTVEGKFSWIGEMKEIETNKRNVRDAVISDASGSIPVSVWDDHFEKFTVGHAFYKLTNMKLRHYNGKVLSTQQFTEVTRVNEFPVIDVKIEHKTLCCPSILNATINIYPTCNNPACKRKLAVPAGATLVTCESCSRKMLLKKALCDVNASIQIEDQDGVSQVLTIFKGHLVKLFGEEAVRNAMHDGDLLISSILSLENVDFELSYKSNVVLSITKHGDGDLN